MKLYKKYKKISPYKKSMLCYDETVKNNRYERKGEKVTKNERFLKERKSIKYGDDEIWSKFIFHSR